MCDACVLGGWMFAVIGEVRQLVEARRGRNVDEVQFDLPAEVSESRRLVRGCRIGPGVEELLDPCGVNRPVRGGSPGGTAATAGPMRWLSRRPSARMAGLVALPPWAA